MEEEDQADQQAAPGCYQDLVAILETFDDSTQDHPPELQDRSFTLAPFEFGDFLDEDVPNVPCKLPPFEYDGEVLYFKKMGQIHDDIVNFLYERIVNGLKLHEGNPGFGAEVQRMLPRPTAVYAEGPSWIMKTPDVAMGMPQVRYPLLVAEVIYANRPPGGRQGAEERYKGYFDLSKKQINIVICIHLHYSYGNQRALQTAAKLDKSAVAVWTLNRGHVRSVMDWTPLS